MQSHRNKYIELQKPYKENMIELMATIMLLNKNEDQPNEYYIDMIYDLWLTREKLLKSNEIGSWIIIISLPKYPGRGCKFFFF